MMLFDSRKRSDVGKAEVRKAMQSQSFTLPKLEITENSCNHPYPPIPAMKTAYYRLMLFRMSKQTTFLPITSANANAQSPVHVHISSRIDLISFQIHAASFLNCHDDV